MCTNAVAIGAMVIGGWAAAGAVGQSIVVDRAGPARPVGGDVVRSREVAVDSVAVRASAVAKGVARLALFDDVGIGCALEHVWETPGGFAATGSVEGIPGGTFSIAVERGQVSAGFWAGGRFFGLVPTGEADASGRGICAALELRPEAAVRCAMGLGTPEALELNQPTGARRGLPGGEPEQRGPNGGLMAIGACDCGDDQSTVDLLVVYTPAALSASGGLAALTARYQDAIAATNQAFINSAITAGGPVNRLAVRLAAIQPISYDESAPDVLNHLERLAGTTDGFMDGVHAQRNTFRGDLVSLAVDDTRLGGGMAYYALEDTGGFSVLNWRALGGGNLTLAHELGHNFGCAHDRGNSAFSPYRWAWGYSFASGGTTYGTIMSYTGVVPLPNYSNPDVVHALTGQSMGTPLASALATHNALAIATTRWNTASFRDAPGIRDCNGNGVEDATDIANGASLDVNANCRPDDCETRLYVDASNTGASDGLTWNTAWPNLADALTMAQLGCSNVSEIWVAGGTYMPDRDGAGSTGDRYAAFRMRTGLAVIGGFQGKQRPGGGESSLAQRPALGMYPSVLSGEIGSVATRTDNSANVVLAIGTDSSAVLDGFTIEAGYQDGDGAGMLVDGASVTVRNCLFRENRGGAGGGFAAYNPGSSPTLHHCTFTGNAAAGSGGAIAVRNGASLTAVGCTVRSNSAANVGGASVAFGSSAEFAGCEFGDNITQFSVGALEVYVDGAISATDCVFADNTAAGGNGGAVGAYFGAAASFTRCVFQGNTASGNSGAIDCYSDVSLTLEDCTFTSNQAGGAAGAVVVSANSTAGISGSRFDGNTAAGSGGGGLAAYSGAVIAVDTSVFRNNSGAWGGAIAAADSTLVLRRSTLETNHAIVYNGGGIDLYNSAATLTNCAVRANVAADGAGGLYLNQGTDLTASNCTVFGNSAANWGGGIGMFDATLRLNNSILFGNASPSATPLEKQLTVFSGTRTVNRTCVEGLIGQLGGTGNISGNPVMTSPATGALTLGPGSPCIDAGDNALVLFGTTVDLAGRPRFTDDPATPDSGAGTSPIVDMGAHEFAPPPPCPGDLNGDRIINTADLVLFLSRFGQSVSPGTPAAQADFNHDGIVNTTDLVLFLSRFGTPCS